MFYGNMATWVKKYKFCEVIVWKVHSMLTRIDMPDCWILVNEKQCGRINGTV